jgi:mannose-6-phosphate isomerase-like protein (cupin superfamily)
MHLSADNTIVETEPGDVPEGVELVRPLTDAQLSNLARVTTDQMRERLATPADLWWSSTAFLDSTLPGGGADLALVIGYGITEDRFQRPRLTDPHGLSLAWLRAQPGQGIGMHRIGQAQVLIVESGRLEVTLNRTQPVSVEFGPYDVLSVPTGAWRCLRSVGDETARVVVLTEGDGRVPLDWATDVVAAARRQGIALDANGYLAPADLVRR